MFALYLKSIEIQGFKSFPTKERLTFEKPITAIIGPNGSGKSNIADAILWVMGEQSTKTLRSGKMEDVIFGGTARRPGQNFAEVSLILDNIDGELNLDTSEVMLTRRYYRSGESEYYINKSKVLLKEITELLMDTGLGREGYCVIGQGRISEILSVKSKERRDIFEEAAGISRFRHRKDEAERKLQSTEENLLRIGDKISIYEQELDPLREQAEVAKKYNLLSGELRGVEISLWLKELEAIDASIEKAESDLLAANRDLDAAKQDSDEAYTQQEALEEMTQGRDIEAQAIRERISAIEKEKGSAESCIAVYQSQLSGNAGQIENIKSGLKSHTEQHDGVGMQINDSEKRLNDIFAQKQKMDEQIKALDKELESIIGTSDRFEEKHRKLISKEQDLQSKHSEMKSAFSALAAGAQELYDLGTSVKQKLADAKQDYKTREDEHKKLNAELEKAQEDAISLENILKGLALKVENRTKKADASGEVFERLSAEYKDSLARHKLLSDWEKEYQGYGKAVKTAMQEHSRGTLKNLHGTVASLVKTDDIYTSAIETALGNKMYDIIVDTDEDAKAAIKLLKHREAGRATFQPISTVNGRALNDSEFKNDNGFIGIAIDLVRFDKKYSGIYTYLLGQVLICEDINCAVTISKKHGKRYRIVSLDGQVVNAGGSLTGGSAVTGSGMLSRANELSRLEKRIAACKDELLKAEREHSEHVREKNAAEYERDTAQEELRTAREDIKIRELEQTHREQNLKTISDMIDSLNMETESIESRIKQNSADTGNLKTSISDMETELASIKKEIDEAIKGNEHIQSERDRITTGRSDIVAEIAALDAEKDALNRSIAKLLDLREEMSGSRQAQMDTISKLELNNEEIKTRILEEERKVQELISKIETERERLSDVESMKFEVEAKRAGINAEIKAKNEKFIDKQRKVNTLELKVENLKGDEKLIGDRLWNKYELGESAAASQGTPIDNVRAAKKRIAVINRELDQLGTPNIGAIKEYERISELYEYLTTQRDDVQKAKTELLAIIEEITSRMCEIFKHEFELINESFRKTFKELFRGGQASLILEDPDDVLNCGIEIEVQPPGKALKTISLLSGGEKAFVAIAIYFAILAVRPPPFVVMDEIDAALDDANVVRFSDYMRYMSDKTQMIVITHKRGTMSGADVLYGITMQELGVSNILCVDLDEAENHINSVPAHGVRG